MDLAYELHDLVNTLDRWAARILRTQDLSYNQYVALVIVGENEGINSRSLARGLGISEPSTSALVRKLLAAGLLTDIAPDRAGNVRRLALTPVGDETRQRCTELLGNSLDRNAERVGIDPAALARTIRTLHDEVNTVRDSASGSGAGDDAAAPVVADAVAAGR